MRKIKNLFAVAIIALLSFIFIAGNSFARDGTSIEKPEKKVQVYQDVNSTTAKAVKKDSVEFDASVADEKFCSRFCFDSSCAEWRKVKGCRE